MAAHICSATGKEKEPTENKIARAAAHART